MTKKTKLKVIISFFAATVVLIAVGLGYALEPLLLAFALAYLFYPVIIRMEKRGLNRVVSVSIIFTALLALVVFSVMALIPKLLQDGGGFLGELPENMTKATAMLENAARKAGVQFGFSGSGTNLFIKEQAARLSASVVEKMNGAFSGLFTNIFKFLMIILNVLLVPLFFFFMILDFEKIKKEIKQYIPVRYLPTAYKYMEKVNVILSGYIRGKLVVALILAVMYGAGLHFTGLKFGFVIGFVSGLLSIIPYVGSVAGFAAAILISLAYYQGIGLIIGVCVVYLIAQLLETYIITPHLVGNSVGLNAFVTILAIIIGGNLMGVMGILIAIPAAAILKALLIDLRAEYHLAFHTPEKSKKKTGNQKIHG